MLRKIPSHRPQSSTSQRAMGLRGVSRVPVICWLCAVLVVALDVSGCAVSSVEPLTIPLVYKPNSKKPSLAETFACKAIGRVAASDARTDKTLGMRVHESKPLKAEVSASGDAGPWVQEGVQQYLTQAGINFQGGGPSLILSLDSLRTSESIWHRSSYDGRVVLSSRLQTPAGKSCWEEKIEGTAGSYGYAGSVANYQETLNGALDNATLKMAESQGFRDALCHCS